MNTKLYTKCVLVWIVKFIQYQVYSNNVVIVSWLQEVGFTQENMPHRVCNETLLAWSAAWRCMLLEPTACSVYNILLCFVTSTVTVYFLIAEVDMTQRVWIFFVACGSNEQPVLLIQISKQNNVWYLTLCGPI